jgi:hypothetical protein
MKFNKVGLIVASIYFFIVLACIVWAVLIDDPKGKFVILRLPLALQMAGLDTLGILKYLPPMSWAMVYFLIGIPTLWFFYLMGCVFDKVFLRK